jgi:hypothetical protein
VQVRAELIMQARGHGRKINVKSHIRKTLATSTEKLIPSILSTQQRPRDAHKSI